MAARPDSMVVSPPTDTGSPIERACITAKLVTLEAAKRQLELQLCGINNQIYVLTDLLTPGVSDPDTPADPNPQGTI